MNFIGEYGSYRCSMTVRAKGTDEASIVISGSASANEHIQWRMGGTVTVVGDCILVDYTNCTKETFTATEDGMTEISALNYTNGSGRLCFCENTVTWSDFTELSDPVEFTFCG